MSTYAPDVARLDWTMSGVLCPLATVHDIVWASVRHCAKSRLPQTIEMNLASTHGMISKPTSFMFLSVSHIGFIRGSWALRGVKVRYTYGQSSAVELK